MDAPRFRILQFFFSLWVTLLAVSIIVETGGLPNAPFLGMSERSSHVGLVQTGGPAEQAGLRIGDEIIAIDGVPVKGILRDVTGTLRGGDPGQGLRLTVARGDAVFETTLVPQTLPPGELVWGIARALASLVALFVGSMAFLRRPRLLTFLFFLICLALSMLLSFPFVPPHPVFRAAAMVTRSLVTSFFPAFFLHFFLLFPYERRVLRVRPRLPLLLYGPAGVIFLLGLSIDLGMWAGRVRPALAQANEGLSTLAFAASLTSSAWLFARAYRRTSVPAIRRKLRVALVSTIIGVLPIAVVILLYAVLPGRAIPFDRSASLALVLVPIGFGYAIVKHGVFDIERMVKRSLVITGVTAALVLLYFLSYFLLSALLHTVTTLSGTLVSAIAILLVVLLFSPIRTHVQDLVDRTVYPERYRARRKLREFVRTLPLLFDERKIVRASLERVARALEVERGAFFPELPSPGRGDFSWGVPVSGAFGLRLTDGLREAVYRRRVPQQREELEADLGERRLLPDDAQTFSLLDARILMPIATESRRFGVAALGRRLDGDPYAESDLEILDLLAAQTALAMENVLFQREIKSNEAISRELTTAQTLQRQLLPHHSPSIPGIEITAATLPCHEVGGDYFDYVETGDGQLSFAVGDVSGKGIPAAILMANVQALFRAEARSRSEPDQVLDRMNRRLCEIERPDRFVSFFCAYLDPATQELRYSAAGHPPPLLVRHDGTVHHLDAGGLLLGIEPETSYPIGIVRLRPGDLVLCYTDGIPDPLSDGSPFREDQLEEMVRSLRHLPAAGLLEQLLARVQESPVLEDDTTLLILKAV